MYGTPPPQSQSRFAVPAQKDVHSSNRVGGILHLLEKKHALSWSQAY